MPCALQDDTFTLDSRQAANHRVLLAISYALAQSSKVAACVMLALRADCAWRADRAACATHSVEPCLLTPLRPHACRQLHVCEERLVGLIEEVRRANGH